MNNSTEKQNDQVKTMEEARRFLWDREVKAHIRMVNALLAEQIPELPTWHTSGLIGRC